MDPTSAIPLILKAPDLVKGAAAMMGLIESVESKVDKLLNKDFNVGVRTLSEISLAEREHEFLLKRGWENFQGAINNEEGTRKGLAYVGLAFCQYRLGEKRIAEQTLLELCDWEYTNNMENIGRVAGRAGIAGAGTLAGAGGLAAVGGFLFFTPAAVLALAGAAAVGVKFLFEAETKKIERHFRKLPPEQAVQELQASAREFLEESSGV